jgi:hypothetical protein
MLYATDGIQSDDDFNKAMVGVASVWHVVSLIHTRSGLIISQVRGKPVSPAHQTFFYAAERSPKLQSSFTGPGTACQGFSLYRWCHRLPVWHSRRQ